MFFETLVVGLITVFALGIIKWIEHEKVNEISKMTKEDKKHVASEDS